MSENKNVTISFANEPEITKDNCANEKKEKSMKTETLSHKTLFVTLEALEMLCAETAMHWLFRPGT